MATTLFPWAFSCLIATPCPLQSIKGLLQELTKRDRPFVRELIEALNSPRCRFDIELTIAPCCINAPLSLWFFCHLRR